MAYQAFSLYESLVLEHEGNNSFDYAICQLVKGNIALSQNNSEKAELCLLEAEQKILLLWESTVIIARPAISICIICIVGGIRRRKRWSIKINSLQSLL